MGSTAEKFMQALSHAGVRLGETPLVLMVSGGSDSTALAYLAADALTQPSGHASTCRIDAQNTLSTSAFINHVDNAADGKPTRTQADFDTDGQPTRTRGEKASATTAAPDNPPIAILHVNHQLRGAAADADERFVEQLAEKLGFSFYCYHVNVAEMARVEGGNVEAIGRRERYAAAIEVLADLQMQALENANDTDANSRANGGEGELTSGGGFVLTAHTQDDRVENFYMRSIVGTGPGGFRSMARQNGCVLHPLLDCSRAELREYISARASATGDLGGDKGTGRLSCHDKTNDLSLCLPPSEGALWCEDATNAETDRFRTFVRHEIVPRAKEQNPRLLDTLTRSMDLIADEDDFLDACTQKILREHVRWTNPLGPDWFSQRMGGILPDTQLAVVEENADPVPDFSAGCVLAPRFTDEPLVLKRRAVFRVLQRILGEDARVETASVEAVLNALGRSGAVTNIQGNLAVSTNKHGTRIEPMEAFRARRKRIL